MNKREFMQTYVLARASVAPGGFDPSVRDGAVDVAGRVYDAIVASTPEEPAWIEHRGEKPYPEGMVEVMFRNGRVDSGDADEFLWTHDEDLVGSVIVRWRPA